MMTWTPSEWGTAAFEIFSAFYFSRFLFVMVLGMFGGAERLPHVVNITIEKTEDT
jgi:hypothetical protein